MCVHCITVLVMAQKRGKIKHLPKRFCGFSNPFFHYTCAWSPGQRLLKRAHFYFCFWDVCPHENHRQINLKKIRFGATCFTSVQQNPFFSFFTSMCAFIGHWKRDLWVYFTTCFPGNKWNWRQEVNCSGVQKPLANFSLGSKNCFAFFPFSLSFSPFFSPSPSKSKNSQSKLWDLPTN